MRKGEVDRSNDIGLTQAFAPIGDDGWSEGGWHAYSGEEGEIAFEEDAFADDKPGRTDRFAPIAGNDPYAADAWDAQDGSSDAGAPLDADDAYIAGEARGSSQGAHAGGFSYKGDDEDEYPDALESLEPVVEPSTFDPDVPADPAPARGRHSSAAKEEIPSYMRKSRRMRRILIVVVVLLVLLLAAGGYFAVRLFQTAQTAAYQQTQQPQSNQDTSSLQAGSEGNDATSTVKKTSAPNLTELLGCTQDDALAKVGRGAQVTVSNEVNEEGNPIKSEVRVALTAEPADSRTGTPTVYLGLDADGKIIQAGYSTSTSSLGYGSLSFADAVRTEHIIEKTLAEAGVSVPEGAVELPEDAESYTSFDTDGTTRTKEYCSFNRVRLTADGRVRPCLGDNGEVDIDGAPHAWSAVLSYDYSMANASDNLADTVRTIFIYVNS